MEPLHTSPSIEIVQIANRILYCNWVGPQTPESITTAGSIIIPIVKEGDFKKVLNDNARVTGPWNTSVPYTINQWFPTMMGLGLKHFAWVYSTDIFADLSARRATPVSDMQSVPIAVSV